VGAPLGLAPALAEYEAGGAPPVRVGLAGEHQRGNAALAVALAAAWEARAGAGAAPGQAAAPATAVATPSGLGAGENPAGPAARDGAAAGPPADAGAAGRGGGRQGAEAGGPGGAAARAAAVAARRLPDAYLRGLAACRWPGRAQARPAHMYPITLPYPTLQSAHVCKGGLDGSWPRPGPALEHARGARAVLCAACTQAHWRTMHRRMPRPMAVRPTTTFRRRSDML